VRGKIGACLMTAGGERSRHQKKTRLSWRRSKKKCLFFEQQNPWGKKKNEKKG